MKLNPELQAEILQLMQGYWGSYLSGDLEKWASFLKDDYRNIGTNREEIWNSKQEIIEFTERIADQTVNNAGFRNIRTEVIPMDPYIMVHEFGDVYIKTGEEWTFYAPVRLSSILEKTGEGWKILHQHGSYPDARTEDGEAFAFDEIKAENKKLRDAIKNRTIELERKNRELEIEAALERVRARAMAMQHPDELVDVTLLLRKEMGQLGVEELETSSIYVHDESTGKTECWFSIQDRNDEDKLVSDHMIINLEDTWVGRQMKSFFESDEPGTSIVMQGEHRKEWIRYCAEKASQFTAEGFYGEVIPDRTYHLCKFSNGYMGAAAPGDISAESRDLLKRATAVFSLAYTRFQDLQKAEAQAKEAKVQLALERVRARTMAMQHSDELQEASHLLDQQVRALGIRTWGCAFNIFREEDSIEWFGNEKGVLPTYTIPREGIFKKYYDLGQEGNEIHVQEFSGEECIAHYEYMSTLPVIGDVLRQLKETNGSFPEYQIDHVVYHKYGYLLFITIEQVPESYDIFKRFARVFEQTYTRFLDLQKAEAQAREAQIELALEKVRAQAMAMNKSEDLLDIVVTMRREFVSLGHEAHYFWHMRWLPDKYEKAMTSGDGTRIGMVMELPRHIHGEIPLLANWEKSNEPSVVYPMDADAAVAYVDKMITLGDFKQVDPNAPGPDDIRHIGGLTFIMTRTTHGEIGYSLPGEVPEPPQESLATLERFAGVFDLAYRRFEDLKLAEANALQAQQDLIEIRAAKQKAEDALAELKVTQAQLIQSEKMASLGELTAGIAHEIQNPLNFVNNFSDVSMELLAEVGDAIESGDIEYAREIMQDVIRNLEKIHHHGKRADGIVKGMLQHSRSSNGKKEPTDINALCDEYVRLAYHGLRAKDKSFNAKFAIDLDESVGKLNVVPQDIGRVLLNIINNAFYAVNEKDKQEIAGFEPTVSITTKKVPPANGMDGRVLIKIRDNGSGIPDDIRKKIFQPFFTTKPTGEGTGLGLSLSYDIITKGHGGSMKVISKEGEFTEIIMDLPSGVV